MDIKTRFEALSKSAYLEVLLPKSPEFDAAAFLKNGTPEELSRAPARRNLFFDEQASVLVVLKASRSEDEIREILRDLELTLGAHATDAVPQGSGNAASASGKHDLGSKSFPGGSFTETIPVGDKTYVIWKPVLPLARPRARLQRPAIYFTANLTIANSNSRQPRVNQKDYLKSFEPLPANVLEPLRFDPVLRESNVFLPESRITKVAPRPPNLQEVVKPIRGASKRAFPAVPALFSKIKYSSLPEAIIASLHLETSHVIAGTVTIEQVQLDVANAKVQHLTDVSLPLETRGGDETIILYRLGASGDSNLSGSLESSPVTVSISADALLDQGSRIKFDISWQTQVDLSQSLSKRSYRWSRPLSTISGHHRGPSAQSNPGLISVDGSQKQSEGEAGVTFNISAPAMTLEGDEFKLDVHCNNRSSRQRRFALVMLQPRKPKATMLSQTTNADADLVASIFNVPPLERTKPADVLDLNSDVRIGPLPAGACFETHLKFRAMTTGVLDLGVLRILDIDTRQTVDVRELPDVIALDTEVPK